MKTIVIPNSLEEAHGLLRELGSAGVPVAGATGGVFFRGDDDKTGVDITRLKLSGIAAKGDHFEIGATTPIADLRAYRAQGWALDRVARRFVTQQIRNLATLGGNIVRVFSWADFPSALLSLDAEMTVCDGQTRSYKAAEFFDGQPVRLFKPGDLLRTIRVPVVEAPCGFGYRKHTRVQSDFSIATAAAWVQLEGNKVKAARIALSAAVAMPRRLNAIESALAGKTPNEGAILEAVKAGWSGPVRRAHPGLTDEYVKHVAEVTLRDAIAEAVAEAKGGAA